MFMLAAALYKSVSMFSVGGLLCLALSHNLLLLILLRGCEGLHCNSLQSDPQWPDYGLMRPCKADPP